MLRSPRGGRRKTRETERRHKCKGASNQAGMTKYPHCHMQLSFWSSVPSGHKCSVKLYLESYCCSSDRNNARGNGELPEPQESETSEGGARGVVGGKVAQMFRPHTGNRESPSKSSYGGGRGSHGPVKPEPLWGAVAALTGKPPVGVRESGHGRARPPLISRQKLARRVVRLGR